MTAPSIITITVAGAGETAATRGRAGDNPARMPMRRCPSQTEGQWGGCEEAVAVNDDWLMRQERKN